MQEQLYTKYKALLFKLAYQLTGSVSDAEDAVQDVFIKIADVPPERLAEPKAYLCKMVTNRCKDLLKSALRKREEYFGEWLPEPFPSSDDDAMESVVREDLLTYGMIVLLERLSPSERIVFVLREALGFEYKEIAQLIEKSEPNCRKLFSRASAKMGLSDEEELAQPEAEQQQWVNGFLDALKAGNVNRVLTMLDPDVVLVADGGGKVLAAAQPIVSRDLVAKFLLGPVLQSAMVGSEALMEMGHMNGQPGFVIRSKTGDILTLGLLRVEGNLIRELYLIRNPDKLRHVAQGGFSEEIGLFERLD
ncbi:RNA polymerase sigma factor SigJ [Cohnella hashimotonis]|uniref:RNA polymerase sigma factor SigJ n=1 Tax=Cohnella hashimotonis TaxID=2826895 RepID=A0ABT6TNL2_9BACL|nr:RNA polymerase sigma factor SigJ [Cohnella hashimotonis]MDI4648416.1 RNA polymerase sigma factor SigJ [Cohnella hashimotonis]